MTDRIPAYRPIKRPIVTVGPFLPTHRPLTLACGHEARGTAYMDFRVGDEIICVACSDAAAS